MASQNPGIDSSNTHAVEASTALKQSAKARGLKQSARHLSDETATLLAVQAVAHSNLAQAYESRTASLQRYYDSLFHGDGAKHHEQQEAAAVLALIRDRLGLNTN